MRLWNRKPTERSPIVEPLNNLTDVKAILVTSYGDRIACQNWKEAMYFKHRFEYLGHDVHVFWRVY